MNLTNPAKSDNLSLLPPLDQPKLLYLSLLLLLPACRLIYKDYSAFLNLGQCSLIRKKTKSKHTLSHGFRIDVQSSQFLATPLYRLVLAPILFQNRRQHDGPNSGAASRLLRAASILGNADDTWSGMVEATSETDCAAYPRRSGS